MSNSAAGNIRLHQEWRCYQGPTSDTLIQRTGWILCAETHIEEEEVIGFDRRGYAIVCCLRYERERAVKRANWKGANGGKRGMPMNRGESALLEGPA